jgi:hypothetical protein
LLIIFESVLGPTQLHPTEFSTNRCGSHFDFADMLAGQAMGHQGEASYCGT